tara:strand:- start:12530 stop:13057 length:528 start_codon:yes stop_codon:yes gene_type:complete
MKIALYGGSFNPFHIGHENIINHLEKEFDLVYVTPVDNYQKDQIFLSLKDRLSSLKAIYKDNKKVKILDNNLKDKEFTYSYRFIEFIKEKHPNSTISLVIGSDYKDINNWKNADYIKKNSKIYRVSRNGGEGLDIGCLGISSTQIREDLNTNKKYLRKEIIDIITRTLKASSRNK